MTTPFLAGRETDPESDVRLAGSAVADRDDIFAAGRVLGTGEFQDEGLVERRTRMPGGVGGWRREASPYPD